MTNAPPETSPAKADRQVFMALAARATAAELAPLEALAGPGIRMLRAPEIGLVMVRGRIGGDGAPFNLGEATVTRAAVSLATGETGFGHVLGRDRDKARLAALADALWQAPSTREAAENVFAPVRARLAAEATLAKTRAAATRVDFFTMVRGDN
ncbi:phosphonate C-P lyase system protein PhnG [Phreatobacter sp.]|uniref:phosphonate C-P lyase system protein PhnG n=1 Tax=Phreatobacter sp. TaxID=1966341 RepID=UPI0025E55D63|nr:phosphonate C-P lyase system protein PhnG [Phreatobacter sp.]